MDVSVAIVIDIFYLYIRGKLLAKSISHQGQFARQISASVILNTAISWFLMENEHPLFQKDSLTLIKTQIRLPQGPTSNEWAHRVYFCKLAEKQNPVTNGGKNNGTKPACRWGSFRAEAALVKFKQQTREVASIFCWQQDPIKQRLHWKRLVYTINTLALVGN
jgi:hypothetical protein